MMASFIYLWFLNQVKKKEDITEQENLLSDSSSDVEIIEYEGASQD